MSETTTNPMALAKIDDTEWKMIQSMGTTLATSGLVPGLRNIEQAMVKVWFGRELGLSAALAVSDIHIIEGKPSLGINCLQTLAARGGITWAVHEQPGGCVIKFNREGWPPMVSQYTINEARKSGIAGKKNWKSFERQMLYARAFSMGVRRIGADLLNGMGYTPEELGVETDAETRPIEVIDVTPGEIEEVLAEAAPAETDDRRDRLTRMIFDMCEFTDYGTATEADKQAAKEMLASLCGQTRTAAIPDAALDNVMKDAADRYSAWKLEASND